jgi:hypothetical protein
MKFFLIVLAMTGGSMVVNAQYYARANKTIETQVSPLFVKQPVKVLSVNPPGLRMRNTGRTLTIIGSALLVGGVIMVATADELYYESTYSSSGSYSEGDPKGAFGIVMIAGGTGMVIPGIIFWNKGHKRYKQHVAEQGASLGIKGAGLALRYRF